MSIRKSKWISIFLVGALVLVQLIPIHAATSSQQAAQEKKTLEKQLNNANSQSDELQEGIDNIKNKVNALDKEKKGIASTVEKLDSELNETTKKLDTINTQITTKDAEIKTTKANLAKAEEDEKIQYESMKKRIKFMYENGNSAYIELILESESISDLLNRAEYITQISEYDRDMLVKYQETKDSISAQKEQLQKEYADLQQLQSDAKEKKASVESLIGQKTEQLKQYEGKITDAKALQNDYEDELASMTEVISALESSVSAKKAEIKRLQEQEAAAAEKAKNTGKASGSTSEKGSSGNITMTYDGGTFTWPCPSSHTISSEYGNRIHPVLGVAKFHSGVDISASSGSAIVAAYKGTVIAASYNATMGNYVMIDHGDGLYTIYMHASALYVSAGQNVNTGDKIAAVGSTGRSTGPHLHFGVRVNGSYVNPHKYIG